MLRLTALQWSVHGLTKKIALGNTPRPKRTKAFVVQIALWLKVSSVLVVGCSLLNVWVGVHPLKWSYLRWVDELHLGRSFEKTGDSGGRIGQNIRQQRVAINKMCVICHSNTTFVIKNAKAVPLQAWSGPEDSRSFRVPDFHDIRHMNVVRLASLSGCLYPKEMFLVLFFTMGWVGPRALVRSEGICLWKILVILPGIDPGTFRLASQRLNHYSNPGPENLYTFH